MTEDTDVALLRALAEVSEAFLQLAIELRKVEGAVAVVHPCTIRPEHLVDNGHFEVGHGNGLRVEWYTDAEFNDDRAISFRQDLSWHSGRWRVEASVQAVDPAGEHTVKELPPQEVAATQPAIDTLRSTLRELLSGREELLRRFVP